MMYIVAFCTLVTLRVANIIEEIALQTDGVPEARMVISALVSEP